MLEQLAEWWNAVELWLTQLWFPAQILLVMAVLLPACWALAWLVDRAVDRASTTLRSHRAPVTTTVAAPAATADANVMTSRPAPEIAPVPDSTGDGGASADSAVESAGGGAAGSQHPTAWIADAARPTGTAARQDGDGADQQAVPQGDRGGDSRAS